MAQAKPGEVKVDFKPKTLNAFKESEEAFKKKVNDKADEIWKALQPPPAKEPEKPKVVVSYSKADARKLFETAYNRSKPEETTDEEFKYFIDKVPPIEAGKEPMSREELLKRFCSYADEIHWLPNKADIEKQAATDFAKIMTDTAQAFKEIKQPQKTLLDFYYGSSTVDNLSDVSVVRGD